MAQLSTASRRTALSAALAVLFALLFASPAAAHAELVDVSPASGAQLERPPSEVRLTFTESVNLITDGIRLLDEDGASVPTPAPTATGHTVTWPMPPDLPDGPYIVTWRVVSADGHPVSGAFSFGVGTAAVVVHGPSASTGPAGPTGSAAVIVRLAGYVAFALFAGVATFVLFCAPGTSKDPKLQLLARCGLIGSAVAALVAILVQGPYTAGTSLSQVLDMQLIRQTLATPFGSALLGRLALYGMLGVFVWRLPRILTTYARWLVPAGIAGIAVTIGAAGHAAVSGPIDLGVDAVHALAAGLWVGGMIALAVLGRSVQPRALQKFSALAMASVLTLVVTGTLNALQHVNSLGQLLLTRYGLTLVLKLMLVAGALAAAAVSRRRLHQNLVPLRSVRFEVGLTISVLTVTALLSMTAPPRQVVGPSITHADHVAAAEAADQKVEMSLGGQGRAALAVLPATTGSHLHLALSDTKGRPIAATRVTLKVANPDRNIAPIPIPMSPQDGVWIANYRFPFPGNWKVILTVDGAGPSAVVTSGNITIRN